MTFGTTLVKVIVERYNSVDGMFRYADIFSHRLAKTNRYVNNTFGLSHY